MLPHEREPHSAYFNRHNRRVGLPEFSVSERLAAMADLGEGLPRLRGLNKEFEEVLVEQVVFSKAAQTRGLVVRKHDIAVLGEKKNRLTGVLNEGSITLFRCP